MDGKKPKRDKLVWALAVMNVVTLVLILTPVGAHVTGNVKHLWKKHIKPKVKKMTAVAEAANIQDDFIVDGADGRKAFTNIEVPKGGGTLVITGNLDSATSTGSDVVQCKLFLDDDEIESNQIELNTTADPNSNEDCTITHSVEGITKGDYEISLWAASVDNPEISFEEANIWGIWVPQGSPVTN